MNLIDKAKITGQVLWWRATSAKRDLDYKPGNTAELSPKFVSAREAAGLIENGSVCISSGMAGNARCSIFYWAIREAYLGEKRPGGLTWITVSAQGGRGRVPGTVEELDPPGLVDRYISGHVETTKSLLARAEEGHIELHTLPQGEMTFLLEAQARGEEIVESGTGVGTFLDPRCGTGSPVTPGAKSSFVRVSENDPGKLAYRLPKIDVAMFSAPYADAEGNIYYKNAAVITENTESAMAARKNGGKVLVAVSGIIEKDPSAISLPGSMVDAVVVNPRNEQTATIRQRNYWPMFTAGGNVDEADAVEKLRFINRLMRVTPSRGPVENTLSRMAATLLTRQTKKGSLINLGIGLPEEVGRLLFEGGLYQDLVCSSETGVFHGLPTPGVYFGAAINPRKIRSSAWIFDHYKKHLDLTVLGLMQVDSLGNVNVSKRGPRVTDYVGPGGFLNIAASARTIIFMGSWMAKAKMSIEDGRLSIQKPGIVKFVEAVEQVTFSGQSALEQGKKVFYVTNVGIFRLTRRGMELIRVAPGIDIERDILAVSRAKIVLPESGRVPEVPQEIMTGASFRLQWEGDAH